MTVETDRRRLAELDEQLRQVGLPEGASIQDLIQHHRANAGVAVAFEALTAQPKPAGQVVPTAEGLDTLPFRSVIVDDDGQALQDGGWHVTLGRVWVGAGQALYSSEVLLPATLVWTPEPE